MTKGGDHRRGDLFLAQAGTQHRRVVSVQGVLHGVEDHPLAEGLEQLGPDRVLSPLTAGEAQERSAEAEAPGQAHQETVVLVVGMCGHVEHTATRADPT